MVPVMPSTVRVGITGIRASQTSSALMPSVTPAALQAATMV